MKNLTACLPGLFLIFSGLSAVAADEGPQPSAPYVSPIPDHFDWVMRVLTPGQTPDKPSPAPATNAAQPATVIKELHYTKVKDLQRVLIAMSNGETREYYERQGFHFMPTTVPGKATVLAASPASPPYPYYYTKGFYCLHWVKPELYIGKGKYKDSDCFYYKGEISNVQNGELIDLMKQMGFPAEKNPNPDTCEAWIDIKTQFPVALKINDEIFEFVYNKTPKDLTLSPAYQAAWDEHLAMQARIEKLRFVR